MINEPTPAAPAAIVTTDPITGIRTVTAADGTVTYIDEPADPVVTYDAAKALLLLSVVEKVSGHPKLKGILDFAGYELEAMAVTCAKDAVKLKAESDKRIAARFAKIKQEQDAVAAKEAATAKADSDKAAKIKDDAEKAKAKEVPNG